MSQLQTNKMCDERAIKLLEEILHNQQRLERRIEEMESNQYNNSSMLTEIWQFIAVLGRMLLFTRSGINEAFNLSKNTLKNWNLKTYSPEGGRKILVEAQELTDKIFENVDVKQLRKLPKRFAK